MSGLDKVMGLANVGSAFLERLVLRRLLAEMVLILVLAVITAVLFAAFLIGMLALGYHLLSEYGMSADAALMVTGFAALALMLTFSLIIMLRVKRLRKYLVPESKLPKYIADAAEAFVNGLLTPSTHEADHKTGLTD